MKTGAGGGGGALTTGTKAFETGYCILPPNRYTRPTEAMSM